MTNGVIKDKTTGGAGLMKRIKKTLIPNSKGEISGTGTSIDFPQEGERVREGSYAIRVTAEPNSEVDISINNGEWQPCRAAVGYWWFDWQPLGAAPCKLTARSRVGKGRWKKSDVRSCEIVDFSQPLNVGLTFN